MSDFNWKEHAECPWSGDDEGECGADRAYMIAEGERLQAEIEKLKDPCCEHRPDCWVYALSAEGELPTLEQQLCAENARLLAELDGWKARNLNVEVAAMERALRKATGETARLREALESIAECSDDGMARKTARAALSGEVTK